MDPHEGEDEAGDDYDPQQEVGKIEGPPTLDRQELKTGEENDEEVAVFRAKLYRYHDAQWKERGVGDLKLLKNKNSNKIRLLMRQDKTGKCVANHFILGQQGLCDLKPQLTNEKALLWTCYDCSDEVPATWQLCVRFTTVDELERFKTEFNKAKINNKDLEVKKDQVEAPQEAQKDEAPKEEAPKEEPKEAA